MQACVTEDTTDRATASASLITGLRVSDPLAIAALVMLAIGSAALLVCRSGRRLVGGIRLLGSRMEA